MPTRPGVMVRVVRAAAAVLTPVLHTHANEMVRHPVESRAAPHSAPVRISELDGGGVRVYRLTETGTYEPVTPGWTLPVGLGLNPVFMGEPEVMIVADPWDPGSVEIRLAVRDADAELIAQQASGNAIWTATAEFPPAPGYAVVFTYDLWTWDSYARRACDGPQGPPVCGGYWDLFSVDLNQTAFYYEQVRGGSGTLTDPLVSPDPAGTPTMYGPGAPNPSATTDLGGVTFAFGAATYTDDTLESATGRAMLVLAGDPGQPYYLSVTLDTATPASEDNSYVSWGSFGSPPACPGDFNRSGTTTIDDLLAFLAEFDEGTLFADTDRDGQITVFDLIVYLQRFGAGCG